MWGGFVRGGKMQVQPRVATLCMYCMYVCNVRGGIFSRSLCSQPRFSCLPTVPMSSEQRALCKNAQHLCRVIGRVQCCPFTALPREGRRKKEKEKKGNCLAGWLAAKPTLPDGSSRMWCNVGRLNGRLRLFCSKGLQPEVLRRGTQAGWEYPTLEYEGQLVSAFGYSISHEGRKMPGRRAFNSGHLKLCT